MSVWNIGNILHAFAVRKMREIILLETYESHIRSVEQAMANLSKIRQFLKEGKFRRWGEK